MVQDEFMRNWKESYVFQRRQMNVRRFKTQFSECQRLKGKQILKIFYMYRYLRSQTEPKANLVLYFLGAFLIILGGTFRQAVAGGELSISSEEETLTIGVFKNPMISAGASALTQVIIALSAMFSRGSKDSRINISSVRIS